jgi:hypothetical protein
VRHACSCKWTVSFSLCLVVCRGLYNSAPKPSVHQQRSPWARSFVSPSTPSDVITLECLGMTATLVDHALRDILSPVDRRHSFLIPTFQDIFGSIESKDRLRVFVRFQISFGPVHRDKRCFVKQQLERPPLIRVRMNERYCIITTSTPLGRLD